MNRSKRQLNQTAVGCTTSKHSTLPACCLRASGVPACRWGRDEAAAAGGGGFGGGGARWGRTRLASYAPGLYGSKTHVSAHGVGRRRKRAPDLGPRCSRSIARGGGRLPELHPKVGRAIVEATHQKHWRGCLQQVGASCGASNVAASQALRFTSRDNETETSHVRTRRRTRHLPRSPAAPHCPLLQTRACRARNTAQCPPHGNHSRLLSR